MSALVFSCCAGKKTNIEVECQTGFGLVARMSEAICGAVPTEPEAPAYRFAHAGYKSRRDRYFIASSSIPRVSLTFASTNTNDSNAITV
jgi:hypothetical protein